MEVAEKHSDRATRPLSLPFDLGYASRMSFDLPEPLGRPRRAEYTPNDFLAFRESKTLVISPKFQRREVWRLPQRSYFIDTIIRGLPVPPLYLRETQAEDFTGMVREVIDGQQRLRSVLDYVDGTFAVSRTVGAPWGGLRFESLPDAARDRIRNYHFSCEVFQDISDAAVLDVFARMNTYSMPLNRQELRNGRYFGLFKQSSYELAREYLQFWRSERLFTEQAIARMLEVEFVSELLILIMAGLQDKKTSIDKFYADYDEEFPDRQAIERRFRTTMDELADAVGDILPRSEFRRIPPFYSLFGAVHHRMFGVPNLSLHTPGRRLGRADKEALATAIERLSAFVEAGRQGEEVPSRYQRFVTACLSQTDNIQPRLQRLNTIYEEAFSA